MNWFGPRELLFEVEGSTTNVGADIAELSEDVTPSSGEEEVIPAGEGEEEELPPPDEEEEETLGETEEEEEITPPETTFHPFERPTIKQLTETYPDLFKKFPSLKDMYFREAEFSKIFPTVDDAKEASENNLAFTNIRDDIFTGDGTKFISAIKEVNEKGLEGFASRFLPALTKISPNAFWRAANPLIEDVARQMFNKGVADNNENLQNAARHLSKYFFNDVEIAEGKKTTIVEEKKDPDLERQRNEFNTARETEFRTGVQTSIKAQLINMIIGKDLKSGKSRIDPDDVLSDFIRTTIISHVIQDLGSQLDADKSHIRYMDSLWDHARKGGRTEADKARIISAYLARAKAMIPSLRSKYVSEALGKRVRDASQRREKVSQISEGRGAPARPSGGGFKSDKKIDYSKTSDEDILNDHITYR